jgi:hypothetical protein
MNAIVPGSRIALEESRWTVRLLNALRTWAATPAESAAAGPLPFANVDDVMRKARAERATYLRDALR